MVVVEPGGKWKLNVLDYVARCGGDAREIVRYALQRLRYKLEYTSVGFELLPNEFTLTELQTNYEIVLGEKLDKRNFRVLETLETPAVELQAKYFLLVLKLRFDHFQNA